MAATIDSRAELMNQRFPVEKDVFHYPIAALRAGFYDGVRFDRDHLIFWLEDHALAADDKAKAAFLAEQRVRLANDEKGAQTLHDRARHYEGQAWAWREMRDRIKMAEG